MKVVTDNRLAKQNEIPGSVIRLYPETNKEMAEIKWGIECVGRKARVHEVFIGGEFHFAIILEKE